MKVILQETMEGVGHLGDLIDVKNGYARNFLLPRKKAVLADSRSIKAFEHIKRVAGERAKKEKSEIEAHAKAGRLEELARIAHSVQGVGYSLGLASFATRLLFLEQDARAGDTAAVASALGPLRRSLESALTALR